MELTMFVTRSARQKLLMNLEMRNYVFDYYNVIIVEDPLYSNETKNKIHGWINLNQGLMASVEFDETNFRTVLREGMGDPVYDYDLILQHVAGRTWWLYREGGTVFHTWQMNTREPNYVAAMEYARAYMSSWNSVRIRTQEEYEKSQAGN